MNSKRILKINKTAKRPRATINSKINLVSKSATFVSTGHTIVVLLLGR